MGEARAAVAEVRAATWEVVASFAGSAGSGGTSRVPWPGGEGLAWCWDEELWPPRVFAMTVD